MRRFERLLLVLTRMAAALGVACLLVIAAMSVLDIVLRQFFAAPIAGAHDVAKLVNILIIAACFPAGLLERKQIQVTLLGSWLGAAASKVLNTLGAMATLAMFSLIAWQMTRYALEMQSYGEKSMVLGWPLAPWWWAAAALFWICVPAQLLALLGQMADRPPPDDDLLAPH